MINIYLSRFQVKAIYDFVKAIGYTNRKGYFHLERDPKTEKVTIKNFDKEVSLKDKKHLKDVTEIILPACIFNYNVEDVFNVLPFYCSFMADKSYKAIYMNIASAEMCRTFLNATAKRNNNAKDWRVFGYDFKSIVEKLGMNSKNTYMVYIKRPEDGNVNARVFRYTNIKDITVIDEEVIKSAFETVDKMIKIHSTGVLITMKGISDICKVNTKSNDPTIITG